MAPGEVLAVSAEVATPTRDDHTPVSSDLVQLRSPARTAPEVRLGALDQLWFQVAGTVCNLRCQHCFISCSPDNHSFWFMRRDQVETALARSVALGVKEYYFTGGEPFMHPELPCMLESSLALGPTTVLTNGTLLPERRVAELRRIAEASIYSLECRVSLDGFTPESNDAIRGEGSFRRCMDGVEHLVSAGFLPILTAMQSWPDSETPVVIERFRELLRDVGYQRARIKILPALKIGAEATRTGGYKEYEIVTEEMMQGYDEAQLLCSSARLVTAAGVYACPILLDHPSARLGNTLEEAAAVSARLAERACYTCYRHGAICSNMPVSGTGT